MSNNLIFCLIVLTQLFIGCSSEPWDKVEIKSRLALRSVSTQRIYEEKGIDGFGKEILTLKSLDSDIVDYLFSYCYRIPRPNQQGHLEAMKTLFNNPYMKRLNKELGAFDQTVSGRFEGIKTGFNRLHSVLPKEKMPKTIFFTNSFFSASAFCTNTSIIVGLERYLGYGSASIQELPGQDFPDWNKRMMEPRYLERDIVASWCYTTLVEDKSAEGNFAEQLIQWGKILFLTKMAFPDLDEAVLLRYTPSNYEWAIEHEDLVWQFIVKNGFLFKRSERENANWFKEAPFTAGLPDKAPDRLGQFIGWQIVKSYIDQHSITAEELIRLPYNELLQEYEIED